MQMMEHWEHRVYSGILVIENLEDRLDPGL